MKLSGLTLCLLLACTCISGVQAQPLDRETFSSPGLDYGPMTWWHWINGNVTREGITKDLHAMHDVGIRGVQMFNTHMYLPKGPVEFASDEWFDLVHHAIATCDSLGMKFTCMTGAGWSGSGGPWISKDQAMKKFVWSETTCKGGKVGLNLPMPKIKDNWYRDEAVIAVPAEYAAGMIPDLDTKVLLANKAMLITPSVFPEAAQVLDPGQVIDLTSDMDASGYLRSRLPEGEWTVIRFGYTLTGKKSHPAAYGGEGYEVDKFDQEAVAYQWDCLMGKLCKGNSRYLGKTFEGILFDSYEAHWSNWTDRMFERFEKLNGYDLRPWIPVLTGRYVKSVAQSEKVLSDFRKLCDHLITEGFYGTMQKKAHEAGMVVYAEGQGGPVPACAMDKIDVPMNEFWTPDAKGRLTKIKLTATQAGYRGRRIVAAEAFTSKPENGKWQNTPAKMKKPGDLAFAGGINRYCFHTYAMQPHDYLAPGFALGRYGIMLSRLNTWWDLSPAWMKYITRSQYILQQGQTVTDVAFLFHEDIRYNFPSGMVRIPQGYDWSVVYPAQFDGAVYADGKIALPSGHKVSMIIVTDNGKMGKATMQTLHDLAAAGAPVAFLGQIPAGHEELTGNMLKMSNVYRGLKAKDAVIKAGITPDVTFDTNMENKVYWLHRQSPDYDWYYLTNQTENTLSFRAVFRDADSRQPEIWDPVTGKVRNIYASEDRASGVKADMKLGPYESVFVVFDDRMDPDMKYEEEPALHKRIALEGSWDVCFEDSRQMPDKAVFKTLTPWNTDSDERIRYYSGKAIYTTEIKVSGKDIEGSTRAVLSLGNVKDIAAVEVNGTECGTAWTAPFCVDITDALKEGSNTISIRVANTWINRVIGDEQHPADLKYETKGSKFTIGRLAEYPSWMNSGAQPEKRKRVTFYTWKHYEADSPLVESGLMGPVSIDIYR